MNPPSKPPHLYLQELWQVEQEGGGDGRQDEAEGARQRRRLGKGGAVAQRAADGQEPGNARGKYVSFLS